MLLAAGMTMTKARSKQASHSGCVAVRANWKARYRGSTDFHWPWQTGKVFVLGSSSGDPPSLGNLCTAIRFALYVSLHLVNLLALLLDGNRLWFFISIEWSIGTAGDYSACESSNTVRDLPACAVKP